LDGAVFDYGAVTPAVNFSQAVITTATFRGTAPTIAQLYSTASYQAHDLHGLALIGLYEPAAFEGINLEDHNLSGVDFGEFFPLSLNNANLRRANIMNAYFAVTVNGANLSEADIRGTYFDTTGAIVTNLIGTDGHIAGLDLGPGHVLPVRNSFK